jgi:hypothetical protein
MEFSMIIMMRIKGENLFLQVLQIFLWHKCMGQIILLGRSMGASVGTGRGAAETAFHWFPFCSQSQKQILVTDNGVGSLMPLRPSVSTARQEL